MTANNTDLLASVNVKSSNEGDPSWVDVVRKQVGALRFGVVQIVVHDSRVVQIERTEKLRLDARAGE